MYPAYVSKHNYNREKQVISLMIQIEKDAKLSLKDDDGVTLHSKNYQHC